MKLGQLVKFRDVKDPGDEFARHVVVENRSERVLIGFVGHWSGSEFVPLKSAIGSTQCVLTDDVIPCES